ncbi:MAG: porin [Asticcacaulis sp.]
MKKSSLVLGAGFAALALAAAAGAHAQSWADSTTLSGRIYADMSDITSKVNGVESNTKGTSGIPATNGFGTDVKRFYVGVDHKFTDVFSVNVTTDFRFESATGISDVFIKKAYLAINLSPALNVTVGANDMPWVPYAEGIYGYRFLEKTVADRLGYATSSDWGLHAAGKLNDVFSYDVAAVNGGGYQNATARSKSLNFEGRLSAKLDQWNFAVGGYTGKRTVDVPGVITPHTASRFNALAAFVGDRLRLGAEFFSTNDWVSAAISDTTTNHAAGDKAYGLSYFGSYRLDPQFTVFAKLEDAKINKKVNQTPPVFANKDNYYNLGIDYTAFKNVDFAFVVKHDVLKRTPTDKTEANEIGVYSQLRF